MNRKNIRAIQAFLELRSVDWSLVVLELRSVDWSLVD
jgi:hypothetical protein